MEQKEIVKKLMKEENSYNEVIEETKSVLEKIMDLQDRAMAMKDVRDYSNKYAMMISVKLQSILRKKTFLSLQEADLLYKNYNYTHKKINEIYDLVSYFNAECGIPFFIDKQTATAFLRITTETYQTFLDNDLYEKNIQNEFMSLEDFLISTYQQSAENNLKNFNAIRYRLSLKNKYGGNEVVEHRPKEEKIVIETFDEKEVKARLGRDYNFKQLEEPKEKSEQKK